MGIVLRLVALFLFLSPFAQGKLTHEVVIPGEIRGLKIHLSNEASFFQQLDLIERARPGTTIDLAYFIFEDDFTSVKLLSALREKVRKDGNRVRLLVDYMMTDRLMPWFQYVASMPGIEIRRFRPPTPAFLGFLSKDLELKDPMELIHALSRQDGHAIIEAAKKSPRLLREVSLYFKEIVQGIRQIDQQKAIPEPERNKLKRLLVLKMLMDHAPSEAILLRQLQGHIDLFFRRMHHKITRVDTSRGEEFETGGRNISDEYNISLPHPFLEKRSYPFIDCSLSGVFSSRTGFTLKETFERIWDSGELVETIQGSKTDATRWERHIETNLQAFHEHEEMLRHRVSSGRVVLPADAKIQAVYAENLAGSTTDQKGINIHWLKLVEATRQELLTLSAYFYLPPALQAAISKRNKDPSNTASFPFYTNSPLTTDLSIVNTGAYLAYHRWAEALDRPEIDDFHILELALQRGEGSLHTKMLLQDDRILGIGSANADRRNFDLDTNNFFFLDLARYPDAIRWVRHYYLESSARFPWREMDAKLIEESLRHLGLLDGETTGDCPDFLKGALRGEALKALLTSPFLTQQL